MDSAAPTKPTGRPRTAAGRGAPAATNSSSRAEIKQLADIFRGKIVDVGNESLIVEVTGDEEKVNSLLQMLRPFGIKEMVRTGIVSMTRGGGTVARLGEERLEAAG